MVEVLLAVIAALIAITLVMAALILIRLSQIVVQEPLTREMVSQPGQRVRVNGLTVRGGPGDIEGPRLRVCVGS